MSTKTCPKSGLSAVPDRILSNGPGLPEGTVSWLPYLLPPALTARTAPSRIFLHRALTTPRRRLRRGTWGLHLPAMVDTQISTTGPGQGYNPEVASPHAGTWTKSCVSRYGEYSHALCFCSNRRRSKLSAVRRVTTPTIARIAISRETGEGLIGRRGGSTIDDDVHSFEADGSFRAFVLA